MRIILGLVPLLVFATDSDGQLALRLTRRHDLDWHLHAVSQVRFTADDKSLVSLGGDGTVRIWDVASGKAHGLFDFGTSGAFPLPTLHISRDGQSIGHRASIFGGIPGDHLHLWNVPARTLERHDKLWLLGFFPDNQPLLADFAGRKDIELRLPGGKKASLVGHKGDVLHALLHPNGKIVASAGADKTIKVWDLATLQATATLTGPLGSDQYQGRIDFSRDGGTLFLFNPRQRVVKIWRLDRDTWLPSGKEIQLEKTGYFHTVGPGGAFMIGADWSLGEPKLIRWDLPAFKRRWSVPLKSATNSDTTADGKVIATGTAEGVITLRDADTGKIRHTIGDSVAFGTHGGVLFDGGKTLFLTASENYLPKTRYWLRLVNLADGKRTAFLWKEFPLRVAGSDDGKTLAVAQHDGRIFLLERDGKVRAALKAHAESKSVPTVSNLRFSPDNKMLASSGEFGEICLWDVATGDKLATLKHTAAGYIPSLAFSHDGKTIAASVFSTLILWDIAGKKAKLTIKPNVKSRPSALAFTRDDNFLAVGQRDLDLLQIIDVNTGKIVREWKGHPRIRCLAFTPDDKVLLSSGDHPRIWMWDLATGKALGSVETHYTQCHSLCISPDGRTLLTTGSRGAIVWNVEKRK